MSEETNAGRKRPELRGKVLVVCDEFRTESGSFWKRDCVVDSGYRYSNPVKVTFKKEATSHLEGVAEGDCVIIPYALEGREYNGRYYTDVIGLGLEKVEGRTASAPAKAAPSRGEPAKPVLGATKKSAVDEWAKNHGNDLAGLAEFCKALKPGKSSQAYSIKDWADVINAIKEADAEVDAADDAADDAGLELPF